MGNINPNNEELTENSNKKELFDFLNETRGIILDGVKDALVGNKIKDVKKLYELVGKISEELGDFENQKKYKNLMKLFENDTANEVIENINIAIRAIIQTINYDILDKIKRIIRVVETLLDADEVNMSEKVFQRQSAQLNFYLIQYIRKMRILLQRLNEIIPEEVIEEAINEWEERKEKLRLQIEKLKVKSHLKTLKYKKKRGSQFS
jgi:hypothetical protein